MFFFVLFELIWVGVEATRRNIGWVAWGTCGGWVWGVHRVAGLGVLMGMPVSVLVLAHAFFAFFDTWEVVLQDRWACDAVPGSVAFASCSLRASWRQTPQSVMRRAH